jgi:tetratricopeptide (TPR) repeat protein
MNSKITKGRVEFNDENYEKALEYFDEVSEDDEDYMYVLIFKISCLMELERYDKALFLIESLLKEDGEDELLLYEKIRCHIALNEKDEALDTLKVFERIISHDNKRMVLAVAKFYKMLGDYPNALKFCNMSLDLDGCFEEAIREKSFIAVELDDMDMVNSCADKLLEIFDNKGSGMISVFLLKLYAGKFDDCMDIANNLGGDFKEDTILMLKSVVYKVFSEHLGVDILLTSDVEIPIDEAIALLKDYDENGISMGVIHGVGFKIM